MKRLFQWSCGLAAMILAAVFVPGTYGVAMAEDTAPAQTENGVRNSWIDENLGPGVARWVDENGNVSDQTGKHEASGAGEESGTDGGGNGSGQESGTGENGTGQNGTGENGTGQSGTEEAGAGQTGSEDQSQTGRQIDPARPMVALTFDDGPFAPVGNQIMDCLAQYGGKATFFVVGSRVHSYQTELQRMAAEGHEIGNHTYDHKYLSQLSAAQIQSQINRCSDAVQAACGVRPALVRPPGGYKNAAVLANANAPLIMWSIDTRDWKTRNASKTVEAVLSQVKDGDIVLMHELYSQTGAAALEIIPRLTEAGYQLVTVSEMAQLRGGAAAGRSYSQFYP